MQVKKSDLLKLNNEWICDYHLEDILYSSDQCHNCGIKQGELARLNPHFFIRRYCTPCWEWHMINPAKIRREKSAPPAFLCTGIDDLMSRSLPDLVDQLREEEVFDNLEFKQ